MASAKRIYLDYASATPVTKSALRAMAAAEKVFANPGSLHADALFARRLLEDARERIASELACKARQIFFTSGLTESNNLAVLGAARKMEILRPDRPGPDRPGRPLAKTHWLTSSIEHSSVLDCFAEVERLGGEVGHVEPDEGGIVRSDVVARALRPETVFVSVGWGNNEIGTIQPLRDIARVIRAHEKKHDTRILFHTDAGQAPLYIAPHVHTLGVDMLSLGSGKLYGPRTIGALFVSDPSSLAPLMLGGGQERGLRAGTEKTVPAAGFAQALEDVGHEREREAKRLRALRDELARELVARIPGLIVNGNLKHALPHMLDVSVPGKKSGEYLALQLDRAGISLSTKSACDEGNQASHVVAALGGPEWRARNTLRFSLGRDTRRSDVQRVVRALGSIV